MKLRIFVGVAIATALVSAAYAQFSKSEDAIKYRKATMFLIAQHFKRMGAVVKGDAPYGKAEFMQNASVVRTLSDLPWEAFLMPGTDRGDTTLKPMTDQQQGIFKAAAEAFQRETAKLVEVSEGGNLEAVKRQFGEVAKNCKSCHDRFRVK